MLPRLLPPVQVLRTTAAEPYSHGGVLSPFGSEPVEEGDAPRSHGRLLHRLPDLRKQADHSYAELEEDLGDSL